MTDLEFIVAIMRRYGFTEAIPAMPGLYAEKSRLERDSLLAEWRAYDVAESQGAPYSYVR